MSAMVPVDAVLVVKVVCECTVRLPSVESPLSLVFLFRQTGYSWKRCGCLHSLLVPRNLNDTPCILASIA
jgi:hypothetical protein